MVIRPIFKWASLFVSGLAEVVPEGTNRHGCIDKSGKIIIKIEFNDITIEPIGVIIVKTFDGKVGIIDNKGKDILKPIYNYIGSFSEGLALVAIEYNNTHCKYGFVNRAGKFVIEPKFIYFDYTTCKGWPIKFRFLEGLSIMYSIENDLYGYIDKTGNWVIKPQFGDCIRPFSEGLAFTSKGYINKQGNVVINTEQFEGRGGDFSDGLALVRINDKLGYIDKSGNVAIKPRFSKARKFNKGMAAVAVPGRLTDTYKWSYINKGGKFIMKPKFCFNNQQFILVKEFSEGLAAVPAKIEDCKKIKIGYINKSGDWVIRPQFDIARDFKGGLAEVYICEDDWGYIDKAGRFIWKSEALRNAEQLKVFGSLIGLALILLTFVLVRKIRKGRWHRGIQKAPE